MSAYLSMHIEDCHRKRHRFITAGSDKTPLKLNLICLTCTDANPGKTAYVAYGVECGSFGQWRRRKIADTTADEVSGADASRALLEED